MALIFVHVSLALLAFIFPETFSFWPLLIAANFADIENAFLFIYGIFKNRSLSGTVDVTKRTWILHSLLGTFLISMPICILLFEHLAYKNYLISLIFGLVSHLILDMPAHPVQMLFWPFRVYEKNPFLLKLRIPLIKKIYPYRLFEHRRYQYLAEFHWTIISTIIISIILLVLWMI